MKVSLARNVIIDANNCFTGGGFDNWLDAVDASYCTFEGGDDPEQVRSPSFSSSALQNHQTYIQDGIYPDTLPGGFDGRYFLETWFLNPIYHE